MDLFLKLCSVWFYWIERHILWYVWRWNFTNFYQSQSATKNRFVFVMMLISVQNKVNNPHYHSNLIGCDSSFCFNAQLFKNPFSPKQLPKFIPRSWRDQHHLIVPVKPKSRRAHRRKQPARFQNQNPRINLQLRTNNRFPFPNRTCSLAAQNK